MTYPRIGKLDISTMISDFIVFLWGRGCDGSEEIYALCIVASDVIVVVVLMQQVLRLAS